MTMNDTLIAMPFLSFNRKKISCRFFIYFALRKQEWGKDVFFFILPSYSLNIDRYEFFSSSFDDYLRVKEKHFTRM